MRRQWETTTVADLENLLRSTSVIRWLNFTVSCSNYSNRPYSPHFIYPPQFWRCGGGHVSLYFTYPPSVLKVWGGVSLYFVWLYLHVPPPLSLKLLVAMCLTTCWRSLVSAPSLLRNGPITSSTRCWLGLLLIWGMPSASALVPHSRWECSNLYTVYTYVQWNL